MPILPAFRGRLKIVVSPVRVRVSPSWMCLLIGGFSGFPDSDHYRLRVLWDTTREFVAQTLRLRRFGVRRRAFGFGASGRSERMRTVGESWCDRFESLRTSGTRSLLGPRQGRGHRDWLPLERFPPRSAVGATVRRKPHAAANAIARTALLRTMPIATEDVSDGRSRSPPSRARCAGDSTLAHAVAGLPAELETNAIVCRRAGRSSRSRSRYEGSGPRRGPTLIDASAAAISVDSSLAPEAVRLALDEVEHALGVVLDLWRRARADAEQPVVLGL